MSGLYGAGDYARRALLAGPEDAAYGAAELIVFRACTGFVPDPVGLLLVRRGW